MLTLARAIYLPPLFKDALAKLIKWHRCRSSVGCDMSAAPDHRRRSWPVHRFPGQRPTLTICSLTQRLVESMANCNGVSIAQVVDVFHVPILALIF